MRTAAESRRAAAELGLILIVALIASAGLWNGPGILNTRAGGDSPFLLQRVYELASNLRQGVFPARWMPDAAFGLGYPFFNYYAALPYYLAAGLNVAGVDLLVAIKLTQTFGMAAAGLAIWAWLRGRLPGAGPLFGAIAYVLAPFHLVNVYVRGDSLSEFYAFVFFPLILIGIERVAAGGGRRGIGALALSTTALILTHNVSAMLFAPFCALYAIVAVAAPRVIGLEVDGGSRRAARKLAQLTAGVGLGLALCAWFWLPALAEAPGAQLADQTTGFFNFANHFRGENLIQSAFQFDFTVDGSHNPFGMGLAQTLAIVLGAGVGIALAARREAPSGFLAVSVVGCGLATFMIAPLSEPAWRAIPPLALAQFPWRFLSIQALFGAALVGFAGAAFPAPRAVLPAGAALALILCVAMLGRLPSARLNIVAADVSAESLADYEWLSGNIGSTIRAEYLPASVVPRPGIGPAMVGMDRARALTGALNVSRRVELTSVGQTWDLAVGAGGATIALPLLYWDAWEADARDASGALRAIALAPAPRLGWTRVELPQGEWRVNVRYRPTPAQRAGDAISLLTVVVAATWGMRPLARPGAWRRVRPGLRIGLVTACAFLLAAWGLGAAQPRPSDTARFVDYLLRPFAHRGPIEVAVGPDERFSLESAAVAPSVASPGDLVTITLRWRDGRSPEGLLVALWAPSHGLDGWPLGSRVYRADSAQAAFDRDMATVPVMNAMPAGPSLLRLFRAAPAGPLEPVAIVRGPRIIARATSGGLPPLRSFEPELPLALTAFGWRETSPGRVCLYPTWLLTRGDAPYALKYSIRLRGQDGRTLAQIDQEPLQGYAPVWSWTVGSPIEDGACDVGFAAGLAPGDPFEVELVWYDAATIKEVSRATLRSRRLSDPAAAHIADASWVTGIP